MQRHEHKHNLTNDQLENNSLVQGVNHVSSLALESGIELRDVPVAYAYQGRLNASKDNVIVVCHALSGSANFLEWWKPLIGDCGQAIDINRYFVICFNALGSPYGTASPVTAIDGTPSKGLYGCKFPRTTIRDDVNLQKAALDAMQVRQIACVLGGSLGGMLALEFAFLGQQYIQAIAVLAAPARYSAWGNALNEIQRQAIYSDQQYNNGRYPHDGSGPAAGLGVARLVSLISCKTHTSFVQKFEQSSTREDSEEDRETYTQRQVSGQVHNYLTHHAQKFNARFDANCYVAITQKIDTHDVSRDRAETVHKALQKLKQPALIIGFSTDLVSPIVEQQELASSIPNATLAIIDSVHGHDGFLLEYEAINRHLLRFFQTHLPANTNGSRTGHSLSDLYTWAVKALKREIRKSWCE